MSAHLQRITPLRNIPNDQEILAVVNETARQMVNADLKPNEPLLPEGFRCDMSRVGFIRRRWERAVEEYKKINGLDPMESLIRMEADLRNAEKVPQLHIEKC